MSFDRSLEKEVQKYGDDVKEDCLQKNRMLGKTISGIITFGCSLSFKFGL